MQKEVKGSRVVMDYTWGSFLILSLYQLNVDYAVLLKPLY